MNIISTIIQKFSKGKQHNGNVITDEMREKALETRRLNAQVTALERRRDVQDKLEILESAITGKTKTSNMEDMFMKLIMAKFLTPQQPTPDNPEGFVYGNVQQPQAQQGLDDTKLNEAVKIIKKKLPKEALQFLTQISDGDLIKIKYRLME